MMLMSQVKTIARQVLPPVVHNELRNLIKAAPRALQRHGAARALARADAGPAFLDPDALPALQAKYPFPPDYGWDAEAVDRRGKERAGEVLRLRGSDSATDYLEIGCWDGMVSCHLLRAGKRAHAIDNRAIGFDKRALLEGVRMEQMDAADMRYDDESFDCVFSYDAFEHVASPERVLQEAARVVRRGGYVYLSFGPLYCSPFGEHAYASITVPYCQFLFSHESINAYAREHRLAEIDFDHCNGWSLERYRNLWQAHAGILEPVLYLEGVNLDHLDLVRRYPSCFRTKTESLDNLVVEKIAVLFRKVGSRQ